MYREADYEMEQLLQSLAQIDKARKECKREFEAHIWFDDGARGSSLSFVHSLFRGVHTNRNLDSGVITNFSYR